jgi:hypothetical protein
MSTGYAAISVDSFIETERASDLFWVDPALVVILGGPESVGSPSGISLLYWTDPNLVVNLEGP